MTDKDEVAVIGHQYLAISLQIPTNLIAVSDAPDLVTGAFDLDRATCGDLAKQRFRFGDPLKLIGGEKPAVRQAGALVLQSENTTNLRLEGFADFIEEVCQRAIVRGFLDRRARKSGCLAVHADRFQAGDGSHPPLLIYRMREP